MIPNLSSRALFGVLCQLLAGSVAISGDSDGGNSALEPLGHFNEPLGFSLDLQSFDAPEDEAKKLRSMGEILTLFDQFLAAQGISGNWGRDDLDKLQRIIRRDFELAEDLEDDLDDEYDDLKDEWEELEDDIKDEEEDADLPEYLRLNRKAAPIKDRRNLLRDYLDVWEPLLEEIEKAGTEKEIREACNLAVRNLYSLFSDQYMAERDHEPLPRTLKNVAIQFIDRATLNKTPYVKNPSLGRLWKHGAKKEATNLVTADNPDRFVSVSELAKLSHAEVAALDVAPTNPMWHTRDWMQKARPDTWSQLENWIEDEITGDELDDDDFEEDHPDFRYDLNQARKILFWDDVKSTATSPKIDVEDVFGREWKLKWGEESVVEPVANRLRLLTGAKFADLTYADVGGHSHLLILPDEIQKKMNPDKAMPLSVEDFIRVMKDSEYDFNARPFILASGKITKENADSILKDLPEEAPRKYRPKKLVGRTWIRFKESMVEAKHDAVQSGGPISIFSDFSREDRALRQAMMVAMWMADTDVKEDNFKSVWMKDFAGKDGDQYLEYFHDPGSGLGGAKRSGEINKLSVKGGTGGFLWISPNGRNIHSNWFYVYRPGIWDDATFADLRAGAEHVVRVKKSEIRAAARHSKMPDFFQECLVWRLTKRRDLIADVFDLCLPDCGAGDAPDLSIPLTTRADRHRAATRYQIPLAEIENDLVRTGFLPADNRAANTREPFEDVLVKDGKIQSCFDTVITGILRDFRHPPGFTQRMTRFEDGQKWISRRFRLEVEEPETEKIFGS